MNTEFTEVHPAAEEQPPNDNIKTPEQLAVEVNALHQEQEGAEQVSLALAWDIGVRLNVIYEMLRRQKWGSWGKFLTEHCPDLSRMTVWRYRQLANFFPTVLQFDGMTLSEAYAQMKIAKFKEESDDGEQNAPGEKKDEDSYAVKLFKEVAKLAKKFDIPATLSAGDRSTLERAAKKLVAVLAAAKGAKPEEATAEEAEE